MLQFQAGQPSVLVPQFDRIMRRIEAGELQRAIAYLAGLCDAALITCSEPAAIRQALQNHPLGRALTQPRIATEAARYSPNGSLAARADLALRARAAARQRGEALCDLDRQGWPAAGSRFDLILAPALLDKVAAPDLIQTIAALAGHLSANGRLVLSAFVPGHLGQGWQSIWLGHQPHRHEPAAVAAAAAATGLTARLFHDAAEGLVWAELLAAPTATGGSHG